MQNAEHTVTAVVLQIRQHLFPFRMVTLNVSYGHFELSKRTFGTKKGGPPTEIAPPTGVTYAVTKKGSFEIESAKRSAPAVFDKKKFRNKVTLLAINSEDGTIGSRQEAMCRPPYANKGWLDLYVQKGGTMVGAG